jgi:hypothetical protein
MVKLTVEISWFSGGASGMSSSAFEIRGARVRPAPATANPLKNPRRDVLKDGDSFVSSLKIVCFSFIICDYEEITNARIKLFNR